MIWFWKKAAAREEAAAPKKRQAAKAEDPVFIYQMGKVGSSTIKHAVRRRYKNTVHTHFHDEVKQFLADNPDSRASTIIITGIRDILKRNISAFFQNIDEPRQPVWCMGTREAVLAMPIEEIMAFFDARVLEDFDAVVEPWFDLFADVTGVDLYAEPFDTTGGYQIHKAPGGPSVFAYRLENFDTALPALKTFLKTPDLDMPPVNIGERKWYADHYSAFKAQYRPSERVLERIYGSRPMTHFYSDAEREALKASWRR